ncbi:hypothetical protein MHYP_G00362780 [Metynnis hypsauchen]
MVKRVLEQKRAITEVLSKDKKTRSLVPTWQDVDILESIDAALSPLLEFTDALSGESNVSVSFLKPVMHLFNTSILKEAEDDTELTRTAMGYLNEKYDDPAVDDLLDMACLVDPRFKLQYTQEEKREYIKDRCIDSDSDPLDWWKVYQKNFPNVSKLAKQYLCIQATSSRSERVFSTGGNIVTCKRAALKPENVDQLVFLARNL